MIHPRIPHTLRNALLAGLGLSGLLLPGSAHPQTAPGQAEAQATSEFGEPLFVNGQRISDLAIKRFLVYGAGQSALNSLRIDALIDIERKSREARGEDPRMLHLPQEIFEHTYEREISSFKERYPTLDVDTEVGRAYRSVDLYRRQLFQTCEFDWLFFPPGPPAEWSDLTKEAINTGVMAPQEEGTAFIDLIADAQQNWEMRVEYAKQNGSSFDLTEEERANPAALYTKYALELPPEDEMFMGILRDYVIQTLGTFVTTKTASDGLPEDVAMTIEGDGTLVTIKTDDVYEMVRPTITEQEIQDAKRFLALAAAAQGRLAKEGSLISEEDFRSKVDSMVQDMKDSMFSFDFVALQGYQFPSLEAYKTHLRLIMSLENKLEPQLASLPDGSISPLLDEHFKVANPVMGLSRVDAEVLLVSAYDFDKNRWKENGWAWAEQEANRLKAEIDAQIEKIQAYDALRRKAAEAGENLDESVEAPKPFERYWAEMMDLHSDYWDPPMPAKGKQPAMVGMKLKGRFGSQTRNDLERYVGETPFNNFLTGDSVTDRIFFDMQVGSIAGPFRGPHGYYIVYLKNRSSATNPLRKSEPRHVQLLREDYMRREFTRYAHEALKQADVRGL